MRPAGRAAAAIEVLREIEERHRPASEALKDWGRAHRFAGSGDRAAIGNLVYDVLRRKALFAHRMEDGSPRSLVLAALRHGRGMEMGAIAALAEEPHGPGELSAAERDRLDHWLADAPSAWIEGNYPEWLAGSFERAFGDEAAEEGAALAERAPVDMRANLLKADREKVLAALQKFGAVAGRWSPWCVRIEAPAGDGRSPDVEAEPAHGKGWFEVQDEGSQVAAMLAGAAPGMQVMDLCAGAGGKTLAMAAAMGNKGQIFATDSDRQRLRPIFDRLKRAGVRNAQVIPADEPKRLEELAGRMDVVLIDAPCSGSGSWRRRPDAKWRFSPRALETRLTEQRVVLDRGAPLVKPGGRLVYVTCSVLPEENGDQVENFLARHPGFRSIDAMASWTGGDEKPEVSDGGSLLLTPRRHGTDGFFIAALKRIA
ncbi:MAG: RsmB/NOP family class I SAM-dependent RNA methyltransferase [Parvibaculaceae bacterium]